MNEIKNSTASTKSTLWEKIVYGFGDVGANYCNTFIAMYIMMYYTDNIGISAAAAGTMMLFARIFDGITDVIGSGIIEKVHLKLGRLRPWFIIAAPLLGISLFLCFHVPTSWSMGAKMIFIFITYTFSSAIAYTIYGLAYGGMLPLMSLEENDRSIIVTMGRFMTTGGVTIMFYITPMLLALGGGEQSNGAWHMVANIYAVICTVCVMAVGIFVKEKELPVTQTVGDGDTVKDGEFFKKLKIVFSTKYTWLLLILFFLFYVFSGLTSARTYYFKDVLGDLGLFGTASMLANIPALFAMPLVPVLFKIFGRKKTIIASIAIFSLSNLAFALCSGNVTAVYVCITVMSIAWVPLTAAIFMYMADLADYIFIKNGTHVEAISSMTSSVGIKIGTGIGSAAVGWGLALSGYNAAAEIQSAATQRGIIVMTTIIPMILGILVIIIMLFWNIDKEKQILAEKQIKKENVE